MNLYICFIKQTKSNIMKAIKTFLRKANYQILFAQALALYFLIQIILRY